jgi:hypothetical protein
VEAFEHLVKVYLETQGYIVTSNVKFPVRRKTKKAKYSEYQEHGYEVDIVGGRHDRLLLGSVKSFFGSRGVDRQGFKGLADLGKRTVFERYTMFNETEVRDGIMLAASQQYGYPTANIQFCLFVGNFVEGDKQIIIEHLNKISIGSGPIIVHDLKTIITGLLKASQSKTYYNDPIIITLKALKQAGCKLDVP